MWYRGFFHQPIALMTEAASSPLPAPISITSARSEDLFCRIQRATATAKLSLTIGQVVKSPRLPNSRIFAV